MTDVRQFLCHKTPSKHRVFALVRADRRDELEAVTTLGLDSLAFSDELLEALNDVVDTGRQQRLALVLSRLPEPVRIGVESFIQRLPQPEFGDYDPFHGRIEQLQLCYFTDDDEFDDYLLGAYNMGFGARVSNEDEDGKIAWKIELRRVPGFVPASAEPRTWPVPAEVTALRTWTSAERFSESGPTEAALAIARQASDDGHWVRLHIIDHGDTEDDEGLITTEWVVDVLDAPIPLSED